jgi:hypothetical protein
MLVLNKSFLVFVLIFLLIFAGSFLVLLELAFIYPKTSLDIYIKEIISGKPSS